MFKSRPEFAEYVKLIEPEAVAVAQEIQKRLGLNSRNHYTDWDAETREFMAEKKVKESKEHIKIGEKLGIPPLAHKAPKDLDLWQKAIKNPHELKLSKWEPTQHEHPLIASEKDGGRDS